MFKNYIKIAVRNIMRHKMFSFINIFGLSIGMTACLFILQFVFFELSFDNYNSNKDRIYKVSTLTYQHGEKKDDYVFTPAALGPEMAAEFPEVEEYARVRQGGNLLSYMKG